MTGSLDSGGLYPITEELSDAELCLCGDGTLSAEDRGDASLYGRAYRRIVCSCGRKGSWSTAPVLRWNEEMKRVK